MEKLAFVNPEIRAWLWLDSTISTMLGFIDMLIKSPARIGPADAIPTSPKESSSDKSPLREATPRPRAIINGVVIAPVVAPDASKAMA